MLALPGLPSNNCHETIMKKFTHGFTLIELLLVIAIIGILMAFALPNYSNYVLKGKLTEAISVLSDLQVRQDAYYADNRVYSAMTPRTGQVQYFTTTASCVTSNAGQSYTCTLASAPLGYTYTINEAGAKTTTKPDGTTVACWLKTPGGSC